MHRIDLTELQIICHDVFLAASAGDTKRVLMSGPFDHPDHPGAGQYQLRLVQYAPGLLAAAIDGKATFESFARREFEHLMETYRIDFGSIAKEEEDADGDEDDGTGEEHVQCAVCRRSLDAADVFVNSDPAIICKDCLERHFVLCDGCEELFRRELVMVSETGQVTCRKCAEKLAAR